MEISGETKRAIDTNKNIVIGIIIGLFLGWSFGGQGGQNSTWIMAGVVGVFIYYTYTIKKKKGKTVIDVINEIDEDQRRNGNFLDTDPMSVRVRRIRDAPPGSNKCKYLFDFFKNGLCFEWEGHLIGVQGVYDQGVDILETVQFLKEYEMKDAKQRPGEDPN